LSSGGKSASFAEGLFKAIVFTRSTSWIKLNTTVPDTEHWREWLRQAELAANQCRTSDDIVEEVPVPRALRRHGYAIKVHFLLVRSMLILGVVCRLFDRTLSRRGSPQTDDRYECYLPAARDAWEIITLLDRNV
jgi:hypothetical protein